jgi:DNA-binding CsgD family transcriptional regulator
MCKVCNETNNWEQYKSYIDILSQVSNGCVFVVEFNQGFKYISSNFATFFGYDLQSVNTSELEYNFLETRIHPDDYETFQIIQNRLISRWYDQSLEKRLDYRHVYEMRVLNSENKYVRVIYQGQVLEMDDERNPKLVLGIVDLSPNQLLNEPLKFRMIDSKKGEIVSFNVDGIQSINLTKREIEILKMVNSGMISKEISDKLSISIHTVNGHRQNILSKMNADNILEAINYARNMGLLE